MEYTWNRTRVTIHSFRLVGIASLVTCPVATTSFFAFTFHDFCFVLSVFARLLRASSWRKERTNACCCFLPSPSCDSPRDSKPWNHNREGYPSIHRTPRRHKGGTSTILTGCNGYSVPFTEHPQQPDMFWPKNPTSMTPLHIVLGTRQPHQVIVGVRHEERAVFRGG